MQILLGISHKICKYVTSMKYLDLSLPWIDQNNAYNICTLSFFYSMKEDEDVNKLFINLSL